MRYNLPCPEATSATTEIIIKTENNPHIVKQRMISNSLNYS